MVLYKRSISAFFCIIATILAMSGSATFALDSKESESVEEKNKSKEEVGGVTQLEEVVVTATKTPQTIAEVPQAVTYIDKEEIAATGSWNVTDTFQRIPGVAVHDYNSAGFGNQLYVRGYDYLRMYNNLDFQIDGISIRTNGDYGNPVLNSIPRTAIDHIEFLRGPAAAIYGEQASLGVINTYIKRPSGPFKGELTLGYGSWDQKYVGMGVTGSHAKFACLLAADFSEGDTYTKYQSFRNRSLLFAPTGRLGDSTRIEGTILLSEREVINPIATYLNKEQIAQDRRQNFDRGNLEAPLTFIGLGLTHNFSDFIQWVIKLGYVHQREKTYLTGDGSGNSWYDYGYDFRAKRPLSSYGAETHVSCFDLGTRGSILTAGLEYHLDNAEQITSWGGVPDRDADTKVYDYAIFAQYELKATDKLTLTGGGRGDFFVTDLKDRLSSEKSFSGQYESAISPRVGLSYELFKNFHVFGSFGTGFRVPSAYELASDSSLTPEKSLNYEAGIKAQLFRLWETSLSFYRTDYDDLILNWGERDPTTGQWKNIWTNAGKVRFEGIEWANYFNIGWGFKSYAHFLLDDSKFIDYKSPNNAKSPFNYSGNKVPYHPRNQVKLGLEYDRFGWKAGIYGRYYGDYYSDPSGNYRADDYFNMDLYLSYTYRIATLSFFLNNVFDKKYYASAWKDMQYPAPGRNAMGMLTLKF